MYQAVIGSEVAKRTGLKLGDRFQVEHGLQQTPNPDVHPQHWRIVGILKPTHTANDRVVFIPLLSFYSITEHTSGLMDINALRRGEKLPSRSAATASAATTHEVHDHEAQEANDEQVRLVLPKSDWMLSAILVHTRSGYQAQDLMWQINNGNEATAANPASEMRQFFDQFLDANFAVLFYIALLVTVVAAVSILVSIYNSVAARKREIAILRALGATRRRVLALICVEAGIVGLVGAILGLLIGHLVLGSLASAYLQTYVGQGINWWTPGREEWVYLALVVLIAVLAGLVPALKAYRTPVATNLVAG
jgi:putative ABC transport system permease protein